MRFTALSVLCMILQDSSAMSVGFIESDNDFPVWSNIKAPNSDLKTEPIKAPIVFNIDGLINSYLENVKISNTVSQSTENTPIINDDAWFNGFLETSKQTENSNNAAKENNGHWLNSIPEDSAQSGKSSGSLKTNNNAASAGNKGILTLPESSIQKGGKSSPPKENLSDTGNSNTAPAAVNNDDLMNSFLKYPDQKGGSSSPKQNEKSSTTNNLNTSTNFMNNDVWISSFIESMKNADQNKNHRSFDQKGTSSNTENSNSTSNIINNDNLINSFSQNPDHKGGSSLPDQKGGISLLDNDLEKTTKTIESQTNSINTPNTINDDDWLNSFLDSSSTDQDALNKGTPDLNSLITTTLNPAKQSDDDFDSWFKAVQEENTQKAQPKKANNDKTMKTEVASKDETADFDSWFESFVAKNSNV